MKLGFLTQLTEEECSLARQIGYDCIEAQGEWEVEDLRNADFVKAEADRVKGMLAENEICISAVAIYFGGPPEPQSRVERYALYMRMCRAIGVDVIATMSAGDRTRHWMRTWTSSRPSSRRWHGTAGMRG